MHEDLHRCWQRVLAAKGDANALTDAASGRALSFRELDAQADFWLARNPQLRDSSGRIWCLALSDRMDWLKAFLAAVRVGAVVLPVEPEAHGALEKRASGLGASHLIDDAGAHALPDGGHCPNAFLIKLTSGTTGDPKPLPFTEAEMMADGDQILRSMSISQTDRNFAVIPLGHSYGLGNLVMPFFMSGVAMVSGSSPYPQVMAEELSRFPCSVLPLVPPLVKALAAVSLESGKLSGLRLVISAGSALKPKLAQRFFENTGIRVHNFYGSSETGGICFDRSGEWAQIDGAVGTPLDGVELFVGDDGGIGIRSRAMCHALYPEGVGRLHDSGELDDRQVLRLTGRHADIVKLSGRRVSLAEIEAALSALPGVSDAYVGIREGRSGEARCVALYSGGAQAESVRTALGEKLPEWKVPRILRQVDQIAYTARGKKDRTAMERVVDALTVR